MTRAAPISKSLDSSECLGRRLESLRHLPGVIVASHLSGATLRRRLADEGTSLRSVLQEARLHHGLALLETTQMPVRAVVSACGPRSISKFSRGFIERFGIAPATVANT